MHKDHRHHSSHSDQQRTTEEAPVKPGYPEHPEEQDPSGRPPGAAANAEPSRGHGAAHEGHDKHAGHSVEMFRNKFWISLLLTLPTVIWGHMLPRLTGWHASMFPGSEWIAPVLGTAVFFYGGRVFLHGAWRELKDRLPGMMTLISLAITVAFVFSVVVTLGYPGMPLWEELATLVTVMLLGHWVEMRSIFQAQGALKELAKLLPSTAVRLRDGREEEVSIDELADGDLVLVRSGASVPLEPSPDLVDRDFSANGPRTSSG
jgi:P-type Cu2+ transporter